MRNMDFEKEYKDMVQRARELHESGNALTKQQMEIVCPALAESEDERIRKAIISALNGNGQATAILKNKGIYWGDAIAYLEKRKEQKPSPSIYWHAIKKGDTLPCRAYLWTPEYEKYHDCFEGRLIPNVENVTAGADMWYLPVDDIQTLPREGIDELPKEQNPEVFKIPATLSVGMPKTPPAYKLNVKPSEWSEEDERMIEELIGGLMWQRDITIANTDFNDWKLPGFSVTANTLINWLKSLRPQPHWKPSEEQMDILDKVYHYLWADRNATADMQDGLGDFIDDLKSLKEKE